uniref:ELMO domain-containing protein n=1 Tax=Hyaloperonospora arabidopsidis (strain Emoy2) TaxID=559515 RepID=M4BYH2_HYAAE
MAACGVLCRYFFQQTLCEEGTTDSRPQELMSSFLLSSYPTVAELRRKFPFEGSYHFRLQLEAASSRFYYWRDLVEETQVLPVAGNGEIRVKVLQLQREEEDGDNDGEEEDDKVKKKQGEEKQTGKLSRVNEELVDVLEDRQFRAFFDWQNHSAREACSDYHVPQVQTHDVGKVLIDAKNALASKIKSSVVAQTLQKHSVQMWEKVTAAASGGGAGGSSAPPTASVLTQLAKLIGAMQTSLHPENREHLDLLQCLWASCFDAQPFALTSPEWNRIGFRHGDPMRETQFLLPLQCLLYFLETHRAVALPLLADQNGPEAYSYALVGSQIAYMLADLLQLQDGGCLGSERPFWRLFEDPVAFFELFCVALRAFDTSWKHNSNRASDASLHLSYVGDFARKLLYRGPDNVANLIEYAYQLQLC